MTKKYLRLTLNERFQHLNLMINFTILAITGFALKYPTAFWVSPIDRCSCRDDDSGFYSPSLRGCDRHLGRVSHPVHDLQREGKADRPGYASRVEGRQRPLGDVEK